MILEYTNKSCIELIALNADPKNSLRSHLRAIMALDHSRLGKKILGKQIRSNFLRSKKEFTLQILANKSGCVQTNLLHFFIHHV